MTDEEFELRRLLHQIASSAGDPPEGGLDRVADRRRRRLRRRRGAVVTAAALAVLGIAVPLLDRADDEPRSSVTASGSGAAGQRAKLPNEVEVVCGLEGIEVPVASVRPQSDGLHLIVTNRFASETDVFVTSADWRSGDLTVPPHTVTTHILAVPPGELTVGCGGSSGSEQRRVDLRDVDDQYREPELECPADDEQTKLEDDLPIGQPTSSYIHATERGLQQYFRQETDDVEAVRGYADQRANSPTDDPVMQVVREGKVVAFAHLRGRDVSRKAPWVAIRRVDACASFVTTPPIEVTGTTINRPQPD